MTFLKYKDIIANSHVKTLIEKSLVTDKENLNLFLSTLVLRITNVFERSGVAINNLNLSVLNKEDSLPEGWGVREVGEEILLEWNEDSSISDFFADTCVQMGPDTGLKIGIIVSNEWWELNTSAISESVFEDTYWNKYINDHCYKSSFAEDNIEITIDTPDGVFQLGSLIDRRPRMYGTASFMSKLPFSGEI